MNYWNNFFQRFKVFSLGRTGLENKTGHPSQDDHICDLSVVPTVIRVGLKSAGVFDRNSTCCHAQSETSMTSLLDDVNVIGNAVSLSGSIVSLLKGLLGILCTLSLILCTLSCYSKLLFPNTLCLK